MAKRLAAVLALVVIAGGVYYFWHVRPQQQELAGLRERAAHMDLELSLLQSRQRALESLRDELERSRAKLSAELTATEAPAAALQARILELEAARDAAQGSVDELARKLDEKERQIAEVEAARDQLQRSRGDLQQQVTARERELAELRATQQELVTGLQKEIAARQIQVEQVRDQLRVELVEEVLFDSGEAKIKPAGLDVLRRVGLILKKAKNRRIEDEGHTDNVPIGAELATRFPTNWELSTARATNVARFLQDNVKIDPQLLSATGYSEYRPRAPNTTTEGRRKNRRIEILLGPVTDPATR